MEFEQKILEFIERNGRITNKQVRDICGIGKTRAGEILNELRDKGIIVRISMSQHTYYIADTSPQSVRIHVPNVVTDNTTKITSNTIPTTESVEAPIVNTPQFEDIGDTYRVWNKHREVFISKNELRCIKEDYCVKPFMGISAICRKYALLKPEFDLIKAAFWIVHDDVPALDEDLVGTPLENTIENALMVQKRKYFEQLSNTENEFIRKELDIYRKQEYLTDKIIAELNITPFPAQTRYEDIYVQDDYEFIVSLADWHIGMVCNNTFNRFDKDIAHSRFKKLLHGILDQIHEIHPNKVHVVGLGDLINGIIHTSSRIESDMDVIEQITSVCKMLADLVHSIADRVPYVSFYNVVGNHGRVMQDKFASVPRENFEVFIEFYMREMFKNNPDVNIAYMERDRQIAEISVCGHTVFGVHGDRDKIKQVAANMSLMHTIKPIAILLGHTHHFQAEEFHGIDVFVSGSFCGVDSYSKGIRCTSKPRQNIYIFRDGYGLSGLKFINL